MIRQFGASIFTQAPTWSI